jgi:CheY-like chemotaxis protein
LGESSILIVHPDRKTQRLVQRILGATGHRVEIADDLDHAMRRLDELGPKLVVVDGSAAGSPLGEAFFTAARAKGAEACMTLAGANNYAQVPRIIGMGAVTNLLVHPMPVLAEELVVTAQKLLRGDLFGVEKYLLWGTELETLTLTRASQRSHVIEHISMSARLRGQSPRIAQMAMLVADELISNAVHNGPIDANGAHYRKDLARDGELELDERHQVRVRWGCDARYLAIEVTDQFGSLDRDAILVALGKDNVRESGGGAGMGLTLAYRSCDHLVFDLEPGKRTEIIALLDVRHPPSERVPASSYNVFVERSQ